MNTKSVSVSVIVPLFNVEELIAETINGLISQTLQEVEFILVDDGSTDATSQVAINLTSNDSKFRIIKQENGGPASARNHGLRLAKGDYICFVDSDDVIPPNALKELYEAMVNHGADLVTGNTIRFNGKKKWNIKSHIDNGVMKPGLKHITDNPELFYSIGPCAKLYRRELIEGLFFPESLRFAEDQPFVVYAYVHAKKIYTVDSTVYHYRLREGNNKSLTQSIKDNPVQIVDDLLEMLRINNLNFDSSEKGKMLKAAYYERVVSQELWSAVRESVRSKDSSTQITVFERLILWLGTLDADLYNSVSSFRSYLIVNLFFYTPYLNFKAYPSYMDFLHALTSKLSITSKVELENEFGPVIKLVQLSIKRKSIIPLFFYGLKTRIIQKINKKKFKV